MIAAEILLEQRSERWKYVRASAPSKLNRR